MHGFYRSTYRDSNDEERIILSTQFEVTSVLLYISQFGEKHGFRLCKKSTVHIETVVSFLR